MKKCVHDRMPCPVCHVRAAYRVYERHARERHLEFSISEEQFESLVQAPCAYCGRTPSLGIDRKTNGRGYTTVNAQPCCSDRCNKMKSDIPDEREFLFYVWKIAKHRNLAKMFGELCTTK